jgi:hypothetical protein
MGEGETRARGAVHLALGLVIVLAAGVALWFIAAALLDHAAVAGPVIAASVALAVFAGGEFFTRRRVAQQYRWDKIAPAYQELVEMIRTLTKPTGQGGEVPEEFVDFFGKFSDRLLVWGSPPVIEAWVGMQRRVEAGYEDEREIMVDWARILPAIRKDLGHADRGLATGDSCG